MGHPLSAKLLANLPALCNMVRRIAVQAGDITLDYYEMGNLNVETKGDGSPVSLADQKAEEYIAKELASITPDIPMVGEESKEAGKMPNLSQGEYFWLVDPLDGTKEFIQGGSDFTVNIALIKGDTPVMGVVFVPVTGVLYAGHAAGSAIRWSEETDQDKSIHVRSAPKNGLTVVASKSHGDNERMEKLLESFKINKLMRRGSSLKICAIAEGKADLYPRLGPTCEWDTAAAHAVLNAAGGCLVQTDGTAFTYGHTERDMLNPEFIAASENWFLEDDAE
ncbi:MAG: 3'(2'),5'-bisphosphate nucleotidase [Alphaproteobacteria bacterium]|nr:3'(2'),5'-bisphosphate nucleotidase [Alphaproteobacteria bacterium]|tara:strand:- start:6439 stop:7275 length:837 start_codon:yes stop_codon:yes gene_type:complete